jgi:hypothetical protein
MREFVERNVDCIALEYEMMMNQETDVLIQCIF